MKRARANQGPSLPDARGGPRGTGSRGRAATECAPGSRRAMQSDAGQKRRAGVRGMRGPKIYTTTTSIPPTPSKERGNEEEGGGVEGEEVGGGVYLWVPQGTAGPVPLPRCRGTWSPSWRRGTPPSTASISTTRPSWRDGPPRAARGLPRFRPSSPASCSLPAPCPLLVVFLLLPPPRSPPPSPSLFFTLSPSPPPSAPSSTPQPNPMKQWRISPISVKLHRFRDPVSVAPALGSRGRLCTSAY